MILYETRHFHSFCLFLSKSNWSNLCLTEGDGLFRNWSHFYEARWTGTNLIAQNLTHCAMYEFKFHLLNTSYDFHNCWMNIQWFHCAPGQKNCRGIAKTKFRARVPCDWTYRVWTGLNESIYLYLVNLPQHCRLWLSWNGRWHIASEVQYTSNDPVIA